jgi:hypothetical protein
MKESERPKDISLLTLYHHYPQFQEDTEILLKNEVIKPESLYRYKWNYSLTSLSEYFSA